MTNPSANYVGHLVLCFISAALGSLAMAQSQQGPLLTAVAEQEQEETLPRYRVEMIVFAYDETVNGSSEMWLPDELPPQAVLAELPAEIPAIVEEPTDPEVLEQQRLAAEALELEEINELLQDDDLLSLELAIEVVEDKEATRILFPMEYTLDSTWSRLQRLDAYIPLLHAGWVQTVQEEAVTQAIPLDAFTSLPGGLDGSVSLYMSRYLHLVMDLELDADWQLHADASESLEQDAVVVEYSDNRTGVNLETLAPKELAQPRIHYRIVEDRKVKRNELHYFDHPKFGVIARITLEESAEAVEETPVDATANGAESPQ